MGKYSSNTVRTYTDLIGRFITFAGDRPLADIKVTEIAKYHGHLKNKDYADSSVVFMMVALRQFMKYLFLRHEIAWDYQLVSVPKYVSRSYAPVETVDARAMIDGIRAESFRSLRDKVMLSFLYSSGVRVAELCCLETKDFGSVRVMGRLSQKRTASFAWSSGMMQRQCS